MKALNNFKTSGLVVGLVGVLMVPIGNALAAQPGAYLGGGIGSAYDEILDEEASAYKIFGGVNLTPNIGMELGYVNLGSYVDGYLEQDGVSYEVIGYLPLSDNLDLYGRGGFFNWEVSTPAGSNSGTDPTFGVGLQAQLTRNVSLRGEYQTFLDIDGGDVDLLSASFNLHF